MKSQLFDNSGLIVPPPYLGWRMTFFETGARRHRFGLCPQFFAPKQCLRLFLRRCHPRIEEHWLTEDGQPVARSRMPLLRSPLRNSLRLGHMKKEEHWLTEDGQPVLFTSKSWTVRGPRTDTFQTNKTFKQSWQFQNCHSSSRWTRPTLFPAAQTTTAGDFLVCWGCPSRWPLSL